MPQVPRSLTTNTCHKTVDIGFILDSSGSLAADYSKEKEFLIALANAFGIGPGQSQAGVVTFSFRSDLSIRLNQFQDINSFRAAVTRQGRVFLVI